jgi:N-acetylmuramoyl-L-alanine amidase
VLLRSAAALLLAALSLTTARDEGWTQGVSSPAPAIVSRDAWGAGSPQPGLREQTIKGVILHHTATPLNFRSSIETKMRDLQAFSQKPGLISPSKRKPAWPDVPYHFYVDDEGRIAEGRAVRFAGDSNTDYDTSGYIQIAIEGNFATQLPRPAQLAALRRLSVWLLDSWNLEPGSITVHRDHALTACPGRNLLAMLPMLVSEIASELAQLVSKSNNGTR